MLPLPNNKPEPPLYGEQGFGNRGFDPDYDDRAAPPQRPLPPDDDYPPPPPPRRPRRKARWGRRILVTFLVLLLLVAGGFFWMDFSLNRVAAIEDYPGRPPEASGTNWLIVGSDSREGLSEEEKAKYTTGDVSSKLTDTVMIAHIPDNDTPPTLVSLPRDSFVDIPGHGEGRINAAYGKGGETGGPALLVKTVEGATGLRIDHYAEINFVGFASIVDAIGGVEMDIPVAMHDNQTGATIPAGKQKLDGVQALAFVRMRKSDATPRSDLDRVANQRKFIGALAGEIATAGTLLNPFTVFPLIGEITDALKVDEGDHLWHLSSLAFAMNGLSDGSTIATTVPVTDSSAHYWDEAKSGMLFDAMREDTPIPPEAIME